MSKTTLEELTQAQSQPFEYAVFSGGGAKGAIYSGVAEELARSGVLAGIKGIAGSSAGAITAAFIASGITPEKFKKLSTETNLKGLLGDGFMVNKDGKPLYKLLQDTVSSNIAEYLSEQKDLMSLCNNRMAVINNQLSALQNDSTPEGKEQYKLLNENKQKLQQVIDGDAQELVELGKRAKRGDKILFKDLALLHIIEPTKFKDLVVTATNKTTGELTIFDARNTPDVEIAIACRASASIPVVFEPVEINGVKYVDGGYRDNVPQKYFPGQGEGARDITDSNTEIEQSKKKGRTLALAFGGEGSTVHTAIYTAEKKIVNPGSIMKFCMDVVFKFIARVGGKFAYSEEENKTHEGLRENALNVIGLDTQDVGTLSFDDAQRKSEYLHVKGQIQTARHFENHEIGENRDKNLGRKEFVLSVFEQGEKRGILSSLKEKFIGGKDQKQNQILAFAKSETWKGKEKNDVLCDFVKVAATDRSSKKLSSKTTTMEKVVFTLNNPATSTKIRKDFAALLGIDPKKAVDSKFKFKTSDFDGLLKNLEKAKPNQITKKDTIKGILAKGQKDTKVEAVKESFDKPASRQKG